MPMGMPLQSWGAPGGIMEGVNELGRAMSNMPGNVAQARATQANTRHQQLADAFLYGAADKNDAAQMEAEQAGARARALDEESKRADITYKQEQPKLQREQMEGVTKDRRAKMRDTMIQKAAVSPIDPGLAVRSIHEREYDQNDKEMAADYASFEQMRADVLAKQKRDADRSRATSVAQARGEYYKVMKRPTKEVAEPFTKETDIGGYKMRETGVTKLHRPETDKKLIAELQDSAIGPIEMAYVDDPEGAEALMLDWERKTGRPYPVAHPRTVAGAMQAPPPSTAAPSDVTNVLQGRATGAPTRVPAPSGAVAATVKQLEANLRLFEESEANGTLLPADRDRMNAIKARIAALKGQ